MSHLSRLETFGKDVLGDSNADRLRTVADSAKILARTVGTADGRRSARFLTQYHNRFSGHRAIIIGNGPSLRETDLTLLQGELTFGLNRIYLAFDELGFHTTFLVAINELLISQVAGDFSEVESQTFLRWSSRGAFNGTSRNYVFLQPRRTLDFMTDTRHGVCEGATVTYVAMQLAFHMGFSKVVLIGVDHNFVTQGPPHEVIEGSGPDPNHFHPDYFGPGFRWQLPDLVTSERAYSLAKDTYEKSGRTIIDATVGGKLDVFPKFDLATALA